MGLGLASSDASAAIHVPPPHRHHHRESHEPRNLSIDREIGAALPRPDVEPTNTTNPLVGKSFAHFIAGGAGGMSAAIVTSPLDVLKTRLQGDFYRSRIAARNAALTGHESAVSMGLRHFKETFQLLNEVYKLEGWRALFKGLGPNLIGVVPARSINFWTYGNGKRILADNFNNGQESTGVHLTAAIIAGLVTGTATNPIWLVKTRLQLDKDTALAKTGSTYSRQYKNSWDCIRQTVRHEGIRGLYRGLSASYLGVTESTLQWVLYERMKLALAHREERRIAAGLEEDLADITLSYVGRGGAAGMAKLIATAVTYPHEVVRTRLRQAPMSDGKPKYTGLVQCFKLVLKEEGMASMYGGLTSHVLKVVPSSMIMFGMYEIILRMLGTDSNLSKA
ncbi:hypothetical protein TWF225_006254 [Orbilia oligospora]|uniref:Uncharacterized protein n=1 Tax=Orbilia oligospora TaxID=2813651 RepID=A0A7C8P4J6_ORBOL|nr:hypothetical protein TWF751_011059 [Orbilia oligospora]KAF3183093.1 hypothetical protein TWF225_006254 [Orbilia oligospora]KAF3244196.1 hypothetical protein TWF217_010862 [Orbilia oligospora]KAF3262728.1 hypothetical protein TWF128_002475 [Orbilia oligospora]KAF3284439.1 hypothetical protein TWF132_009858 [Orbilia oligospora]